MGPEFLTSPTRPEEEVIRPANLEILMYGVEKDENID